MKILDKLIKIKEKLNHNSVDESMRDVLGEPKNISDKSNVSSNDLYLSDDIDTRDFMRSLEEEKSDSVSIVNQDIARAIHEKTGRTEEDDDKIHHYEIGGYIFDTYYEYRNAEDDIKKIEIIKKNIDIKDPEAAVKLYNLIREGKIYFKSSIGEKFFDYVGDVVAERSVGLLEDKKVVDEAEGQAKTQKWLAFFVIILAIISFSYFLRSEIKEILVARKIKSMQEKTLKSKPIKKINKKDQNKIIEQNKKFIPKEEKNILPEYKDAHNKNPDMIGWINVLGTKINYPIMQKKNDNEYYLIHSFDKTDDKNGCIFMDYRSNYINPTTNTIIYGHDTKTGLMFGDLKKFLDKDFFEGHRNIELNTLYEKREYKIEAVGLSTVHYKDEDKYRYYNFIQAKTKKDWDEFYENVCGLNIYGSNIDIDENDQLLTLSTCSTYMKDGRLFIVAKRIK